MQARGLPVNADVHLPSLDPALYRPVDRIYRIGSMRGLPTRGLDVIETTTGDRLYITGQSCERSEILVRSILGEEAVLGYLGDLDEEWRTYAVPEGARLLSRTLRASPYHENYTEQLKRKAGSLLTRLEKIDPRRFGINIDALAIAHGDEADEADDAYLTIVPPLAATIEY